MPPEGWSGEWSGEGSRLAIQFQSYAEAYGNNFEDCRRRVPDLSKLRRLTGLQARYGLDDIIRELVEVKGRVSGQQSVVRGQ
jgi:nucleoside-diphosphate-sugar epimerase